MRHDNAVHYVAGSSLGWLDLDSAASERVGTLIKALEEPGTLDVIGLGAVRDAFSDILAPGTSTIQTRLRYFLFLPWICQGLERDRVRPDQFAARLRHDEARLIDCLRHLGPNHGVQGYTSGRDLKRMPSAAYWGGLYSWGLRRLDLSIAEYAQRITALSRAAPQRDDDGSAITDAASMWVPMVEPPGDFLAADVTFELTEPEASLLSDHIRRNHPGSLLAAACASPGEAAAAAMPWDVPERLLGPELLTIVGHARCVSELTTGPQHLYNLLLARRAEDELGWDTSKLQATVDRQLDDWIGLVLARRTQLRAWVGDLDAFWELLVDQGVEIDPPTVHFITAMVTRAVDDPAAFIEDAVVHELIRDRELRLKSARARLVTRTALENWNQEPLGSPLTYRWPTARSYLGDLGAALGPAA